jgi:hypothetical protein
MKTPLELLNDIQIAAPCPAPWEDMRGDEQVRHCDQCDQLVYDLSTLTAREALDLIHEKEGRLCVQLYRRKDGTVLTSDCPVGVRQNVRRIWKRYTALAASVIAFLFIPGYRVGNSSDSDTTTARSPDGEKRTRLGGVVQLPADRPK